LTKIPFFEHWEVDTSIIFPGGNGVARPKLPLTTGSHGTYQWLTTGQHDLDTLLRLCPQALLKKYVAITSLDSGPLILNDKEISAGWESRESIAYSPRVPSVEKLPHGECGGFDEWYVFETPADLGRLAQGNLFEAPLQRGLVAVFVNFGGFGFHSPTMKDLADLFWTQLEWIQPESYLADGDLLNFVSRDEDLFTTVRQALSDSTAAS
jgi:hypothetical protein